MNSIKLSWLLASVGLLFGCGSDSSSDEDTIVDTSEPSPTILSTYNFEIGGVQAGTDMVVDVGGQFEVGIDLGDTLRGSVMLSPAPSPKIELLSFVTEAGSTMTLTVAGTETELDGEFTVSVTSAIEGINTYFPLAGSLDVVTAADVATVVFTQGGFELSLNGGPATLFDVSNWEEFYEMLHDSQAETWQRRASLAGGTLALIIDHMRRIGELLGSLELTESPDPIVTSCDDFQGTPPVGVLSQGEHVLTRLGSGEDLSSGDVFNWAFTNCWSASSNTLIDNFLQMQNYIEVIDASNTLTQIGFGPDNNVTGGILHFDWSVAETEGNEGVYTIDPADRIVVNGGFSLLFTGQP